VGPSVPSPRLVTDLNSSALLTGGAPRTLNANVWEALSKRGPRPSRLRAAVGTSDVPANLSDRTVVEGSDERARPAAVACEQQLAVCSATDDCHVRLREVR
jgi:hypothetical protein